MFAPAPKLLQVPSAVPPGYGGEAYPPAAYAKYFVTFAVPGPASIMRATAVEPPIHQAMFWPPTEADAQNRYLHPLRRAESPQIPHRGASAFNNKASRRVAFKGPAHFMSVQAPSIDSVQTFMAQRQRA